MFAIGPRITRLQAMASFHGEALGRTSHNTYNGYSRNLSCLWRAYFSDEARLSIR